MFQNFAENIRRILSQITFTGKYNKELCTSSFAQSRAGFLINFMRQLN